VGGAKVNIIIIDTIILTNYTNNDYIYDTYDISSKVKVSVVTDLEVESGVRLKESYVSGKIGPIEIPLSTVKT
jgi:hypothetical protein